MKINVLYLAAEIARRVPDMALDSRDNNEALIAGLIRREMEAPAAGSLRLEPRLRPVERREWLKRYVREHNLFGDEDYAVLEKHAQALKACGFYAMTSVNADIVYRLKKSAARALHQKVCA